MQKNFSPSKKCQTSKKNFSRDTTIWAVSREFLSRSDLMLKFSQKLYLLVKKVKKGAFFGLFGKLPVKLFSTNTKPFGARVDTKWHNSLSPIAPLIIPESSDIQNPRKNHFSWTYVCFKKNKKIIKFGVLQNCGYQIIPRWSPPGRDSKVVSREQIFFFKHGHFHEKSWFSKARKRPKKRQKSRKTTCRGSKNIDRESVLSLEEKENLERIVPYGFRESQT